MGRYAFVFALVALAGCTPKPASAPVGSTVTVRYADGHEVTGELREQDDKSLTLDTHGAGRLLVDRSDVERVRISAESYDWPEYPAEAREREEQTDREFQFQVGRGWYGWQILLPVLASDALAATGVVLLAQGKKDVGTPLLAGGIAGHLSSGMIVHLANGEPKHAGYSVLLHVLAPLAPFSGAGGLGPCKGNDCLIAFAIGSAACSVLAAVIDITMNSTRTRKRDQAQAK